MKKKLTYRLLNIMVVIGIILTIATLLLTPLVLTAFFKASSFNLPNDSSIYLISFTIYLLSVPYVYSLFLLKGICKELWSDQAFNSLVAKKFRLISYTAIIEAILVLAVQMIVVNIYHIYLYALTIIPTFIVIFICLSLALLAYILNQVFMKASEIKQENDLTI